MGRAPPFVLSGQKRDLGFPPDETRGEVAMATVHPPTRIEQASPRRMAPPGSGIATMRPRRVVACYSVLDAFMRACGFDDFTESL